MEKIPSIAIGTWSWGSGFAGGDQVFGNSIDIENIRPVFDAAMKAGLSLWDTAAVYGGGSSETILGACIKGYDRKDLLLSTKFTPQIAAGGSGEAVARMLNESVQRLGTDYIDIYWIHNPADIEKWTPALIPLLKAGTIKQVGVSNHNLEQIKRANEILAKEGFHVSAVQNHYSLLYRSSEEAGILDYCREHNITFFAYMVLEQGALSGQYNTKNPLPKGSGRGNTYNGILPQLEELTGRMKQIGEKYNATVAQIAIAWAIAKHTLPIIGVTKIPQVADAAKAASIVLSVEDVATLESLAAKTGVNTKGSWENDMKH